MLLWVLSARASCPSDILGGVAATPLPFFGDIMSAIKDYVSGSINPKHLIDTIDYKIRFAADNPDYFYPAGIWMFCGPQGSGKTLSAVQCLKKVAADYPKAIIASNMPLYNLDRPYIPFETYDQLISIKNGIEGVIILIDEFQVWYNCLESKDIPIEEVAAFCQMRKDRRVIIGTSQVYKRVAIQIREQLQYLIDCHNLFTVAQLNYLLDPQSGTEENGHLDCDKLATKFFFHSPDMYRAYETLNKIERPERKALEQKGVLTRGRVGSKHLR